MQILEFQTIIIIKKINITTNGVLTKQYIPQLKDLGIKDINLSIDTLDRQRFFNITRRDELPKVMETLYAMLDEGFNVKINAVVMDGKNTEDIYQLVKFTEKHPL